MLEGIIYTKLIIFKFYYSYLIKKVKMELIKFSMYIINSNN